MRNCTCFNHDWLFASEQLDLDAPDSQFEAITLPHTNRVFPHNNFSNLEYQFISTYRKRFSLADDLGDSQIFLDFDGVMLACTVYLNGKLIGEHLGGYMSFSMDITQTVQSGENLLTVFVDSREREDVPPYGHLVDYLTFGGIYRDVHLRIVDPIHINDLFIRTSDILSQPRLTCEVSLSEVGPNLKLSAVLTDQQGKQVASAQTRVVENLVKLEFDSLPEIILWSIDQPTLYTIQISLIQDNRTIDSDSSRFGFRTAEFRPDGGFYLNGERIKLFGLNRHQTYPYIGAAAPARLQRQDADIIKYELSCNIVRTAHYPQSPHFLDRCDEIGLFVFEEITGWQDIGDADWRQISLAELEAMIKRDRNRPSVILWGVRINESPDDDEFYTQTNALAHELDPTRQTGGVRCFLGSSFLEDVYTYNDFSNTVLEPTERPYMITEFAGHMFPTKTWDQEERKIDHALLHASIQDLQMGNPGIAGAIGWCAFDYATHAEFGSGDGVCYHGVMDIFRLPKWAAYFYKSQQPPEKQVILQAATQWTMGDRAGGGNTPLTVFSNCDEIEIHIGEYLVGKFQPDSEGFPYLRHPPFTIPIAEQFTAWGQAGLNDLHLVGYMGGKPAAEQWIASSQLPARLELSSDTDRLYADGADMTRLTVRVTDPYGNPLPYAFKVINCELEGPAELIGENPLLLVGGQAALYIKAGQKTGRISIRAKALDLPDSEVGLDIIEPVQKQDQPSC
jgi:beta-galactosidase